MGQPAMSSLWRSLGKSHLSVPQPSENGEEFFSSSVRCPLFSSLRQTLQQNSGKLGLDPITYIICITQANRSPRSSLMFGETLSPLARVALRSLL